MERHDLSTLRYVAQAGGAMRKEQLLRLQQRLGEIPIYVMYGQTEATSRLTYLEPGRLSSKLGSVGRAIPGVDVSVRLKNGKEAPIMTTGEICAKGSNVMLGYWKDQEATEQTLRDGWLWTGDLGYKDEEGYLYIRGRSSGLIKTGANRVSAEEVEEVLSIISGVDEAGVVGVPDQRLGQAIGACVVRRQNASLSEQDIKSFCLQELPSYKVPKFIQFVARLPKTASGKIQRHKLLNIISG